jgi:glycosyltransferase involved in cell wall biosynthesis
MPAGMVERYHTETGWNQPVEPELWFSQIGSKLDNLDLDTLIIGYPWLVDFAERLPVNRQVGIVYDAIPNRYCLTENGKPFEFANQHLKGFRYYRENCELTLGISEAVTHDLVQLLKFTPEQVSWLPPLVPTDCLVSRKTVVKRQEKTVLLASPLDRRKGLAVMPKLIAGLGRDVELLTMYGGVRCSPEELQAFFKALPQGLAIEWYPRATAATTERLFREAKLLLFPSHNEGLGLPIIEAQLRGCPAVTRNDRPMSDLARPGSPLLTDKLGTDIEIVRQLFTNSSFDHNALEQDARNYFETARLPALVHEKIMGPRGLRVFHEVA